MLRFVELMCLCWMLDITHSSSLGIVLQNPGSSTCLAFLYKANVWILKNLIIENIRPFLSKCSERDPPA